MQRNKLSNIAFASIVSSFPAVISILERMESITPLTLTSALPLTAKHWYISKRQKEYNFISVVRTQ